LLFTIHKYFRGLPDKITVLHHGEVILSGTPEEVRNNEEVRKIYFGGGAKAHA